MELKNGFEILPKNKRKNILLLSDDIRFPSGVGVMSKEIILGTCHHYNWIQIGGAANHPYNRKTFDMSKAISDETGVEDVSVKIYSVSGYGVQMLLRHVIKTEKIDCILHFTDPRYWIWLYQMQGELSHQVPICYYSLWDDTPVPFYNKSFYRGCNVIMSINRQSHEMMKVLLDGVSTDVTKYPAKKNKVLLDYVPHGIDMNIFYPMNRSSLELTELKEKLFDKKDIRFVVLFNNRNIRRKMVGDVILAYRTFFKSLDPETSKYCALLLHTEPIDSMGTDIPIIVEHLAKDCNIYIDDRKVTPKEMNLLYNISDVTVNIACAEGFGLSSAESIMAGTMVINNVTGGLQDQMRFEDADGNWIELNEDFMTNHNKKYHACGRWAVPVFPKTRSLSGSTTTPYIFEDRCSWEDVAEAIVTVFKIDETKRKEYALSGREWMLTDEAGMASVLMDRSIMVNLDRILSIWTPSPTVEMVDIDNCKYGKDSDGILLDA